MSVEKLNEITINQLKTYLYSLEKEKTQELNRRKKEYLESNSKEKKRKQEKALAKIENELEKEYATKMNTKDEIMEILEEIKDVPKEIEKLQIAEYMIYRVDLMRAERYINRIIRGLEKHYDSMKNTIEKAIEEFPALDEIEQVNFSEFDLREDKLSQTKEQYKLEYTEEERNKLIEKELEIIMKLKEYNEIPMPHEILKNSDKYIQSKMQKFNNMREKRIKILSSLETDYKRTLDSREINQMIDDAIEYLGKIQDELTETEYNKVKKMLIKRRKRIFRSTKDLRNTIITKEKKTGVLSFNVQEARYQRMETLRQRILAASELIKQHPIEDTEEQLEKLKKSYAKEKQFASVIEKLNSEKDESSEKELQIFENRIDELDKKISTAKKIKEEQEEIIKDAKKELIILWKIEIEEVIARKHDSLEISAPVANKETDENKIEVTKGFFSKLKKSSGGKHACT